MISLSGNLCGWAGAAMVLAGGQAALSATEADVRRWLQEQRELAVAFPPIRGVELRWRLDLIEPVPSARELEELRSQARDHPDHPAHARLARLDKQKTPGVTSVSCMLWAWGPKEWRLSEDFEDASTIDIVWTPASAWCLGGIQLTVSDPSNLPTGQPMQSVENTFCRTLNLLMNGGLRIFPRETLVIDAVSVSNDTWSAQAHIGEAASLHLDGVWDPDNKRGQFTQTTINQPEDSPPHDPRLAVWKFAEWRPIPAPDERVIWTASRAERFSNGATTPDQRVVLESSRLFDRARFDALTAVPTQDGEDAIRGKSKYTQVYDYRPNVLMATRTQPGGEQQMIRPLSLGQPDSNSSIWSKRLFGWAVAGALLVILLVLRWRRSVRRLA